MKRSIALILALLMTASLLASCGGAGNTPAPQSSSAAPSSQSQAAPSSQAPEVKEPVTVRVMLQARAEGPVSNDMPFIQKISETAGIKFDWEQAPADGNQYTEKFNILIASGNVPDIMIHSDKTILNNGGVNGVFEDLRPWVESSMPNLQKLFAEREGFQRDIMTDDGQIYYLPRLTAVRTMNMFLVRQDIMEKENLQIPKTTDDMYELLKFFKAYDLNGNGQADEIPWTCRNKLTSLSGFFEAYGIYLGDDFFVEDGKVQYTFANDGFRQGLEYTAKLYAEGLIDGEFSTNDIKVWDSRLSNEVSAMTWDSFVRVDYLNNLVTQVNPDAIFSSIPPLANAAGEHKTREQQNKYGPGASISAKSPYKQEIIDYFNWIHSEEGHEILNFGIEGETYVKDNNTYKYTDLVMNDPNHSGLSKLFTLGFRDHWPYRTDMAYENAMNSEYQNKIRDDFSQYVQGDRFPTTLTYTEAERQIINTKYQEVKTLKDEMVYKFIMGIEPLSKYEDYASMLDKIGLQDVLAVQQAAYDRYLSR